jgi:RNA polymerase sigma factor (TIGR02999 family)
MPAPARQDVTQALAALTDGDDDAAAQLMDLIYEELRSLAGSYFRGQPGAHTLQPTALVHEAFVKVTDRTGLRFNDRAHFFAICAVTMRGILADHARRRRAAKHGGDRERVSLENVGTPARRDGVDEIDALALDEALTELAARSERQARIVEYRFFAGMTVDEITRVLGVSRSTVEEDWRMARAWLTVQLRKDAAS